MSLIDREKRDFELHILTNDMINSCFLIDWDYVYNLAAFNSAFITVVTEMVFT